MSNKICTFCNKNDSAYTCPRCYAKYCSVNCYKSESHLECSETFYKQCFLEGLKDINSQTKERKKIMDILQRMHNQSSNEMFNFNEPDFDAYRTTENNNKEDGQSDDDDDDGNCKYNGSSLDGESIDKNINSLNIESLKQIEESLKDLNLKNENKKLWNMLNGEEKILFHDMLSTGKIDLPIEQWKPWWLLKLSPFIDDETEFKKLSSELPSIWTSNKKVDQLLNYKPPSNNIACNLINVLYAFTYIIRLYNGEIKELAFECSQSLLSLSAALNNESFNDPKLSINHCLQLLEHSENVKDLYVSRDFSLAIIEDVVNIIKGPNSFHPSLFLETSLSEIRKIFLLSRKSLEQNPSLSDNNNTFKSSLFKSKKKIEFYSAWLKTYRHLIEEWVPTVEVELCRLTTEMIDMKEETSNAEKIIKNFRNKKILIEEL